MRHNIPALISQRMQPLVLACALAALNGCFLWSDSSSTDNEATEEEQPAKELKPAGAALSTEAPEPELIRLSKRLYQAGMYSLAQDSLNSLKDRYPLGAYGSFAAIKAADAYYYNREFDKAGKNYEDFLKDYPGSADAPYVKLQAARSHLVSAQGTGRDRQPLERALALFDELISEFPGTPYAVIAASERTPALNDLISYDQFIITFYEKRGNSAAVTARKKLFQERWGARMNAGELLPTLENIPLKPLPAIVPLEMEPENRQAHSDSLSVSLSGSLSDSPLGLAPPQATQEEIDPELISIKSVACHTEEVPFAMLELSRFPEIFSLGHVAETLHPTAGIVEVAGLLVRATQPAFNCFEQNDLLITSTGALQIRSTEPLILTTLDNPTRILLTKVR